jgi:ammonia channel protein AmtB
MIDGLIGALAYWAIGWALAYGPGSNGFIGESNFFRSDLSNFLKSNF